VSNGTYDDWLHGAFKRVAEIFNASRQRDMLMLHTTVLLHLSCLDLTYSHTKHQAATRPGTQNFYFQDRKNLKFQDIFQDIRVTKNAFFVISGAYNFGTFRA